MSHYEKKMRKKGRWIIYYYDPTIKFWKPVGRFKTWKYAAFCDIELFMRYMYDYNTLIRTRIRKLT